MRYTIFSILLLFLSCDNTKDSQETKPTIEERLRSFENDLREHQAYLHIPGIAALILKDDEVLWERYFGYANLEDSIALSPYYRFPIASVSKTFASTVILKLVENGILSLEDPIAKYGLQSSPGITIRHLLSHTSEGTPGTLFNYSYRYGWLTGIIEAASGKPYEKLLDSLILQPLALTETVPLVNQQVVDSLRNDLASPYTYYGEIEPGHFDPGLSAASGLSSTVRDLARFEQGLNTILKPSSLQEMFTPTKAPNGMPLPYGLGTFTQHFQEEKLTWGYGQEDCFSSLVLRVPNENITLLLLANNNLLSDPARLISGDVTSSLFAMSFLKKVVFPEKVMANSILQAEGLAASFLGYGEASEAEKSFNKVRALVGKTPDLTQNTNVPMLHLLQTLSTRGYRDFDEQLVAMGEKILTKNPDHPYANMYMAFHYEAIGEIDKKIPFLETVGDAENFSPFWYTVDAWLQLANYYDSRSSDKALLYWQKILDFGWNYNGAVDLARSRTSENGLED